MVSKLYKVICTLLMVCLWSEISQAAEAEVINYSSHPSAKAFVEKMVKKHQFDRSYIQGILSQAEKKQSILDAISRPAEKTKEWYEYREIFLGGKRIEQGVAFWNENAQILSDVAKQYGVEPEIIVAIIGVETRYGRNTGSYRVIDSLATLGFDYAPRSEFFIGQLEQFFILAREQNQDPLGLKGSYAGAMGYGQFIPSSYRSFAKDNDGDGFADIWNNKSDAIGSVANYFKAHGWQAGQPVLVEAKVVRKVSDDVFNSRSRPDKTLKYFEKQGILIKSSADISKDMKVVPLQYKQKDSDEYWFGFNNFYVITRYNRSRLYAKAVWDLSQAILAAHAETKQVD